MSVLQLQTNMSLPNAFLSPENCLSPRSTALKASSDGNRRRGMTFEASLYEVLRVKRNASKSEIKSAYRTLAKIYHPDSSAIAAASDKGLQFMAINQAYETLTDPNSRAVYDLSIGAFRRRSEISMASSSGFYSTTRRWETDQCW